MYPYDIRTGKSLYSLECLSTFKLEVRKGKVYLEEDSPIIKRVIPQVEDMFKGGLNAVHLFGCNPMTVSFALKLRSMNERMWIQIFKQAREDITGGANYSPEYEKEMLALLKIIDVQVTEKKSYAEDASHALEHHHEDNDLIKDTHARKSNKKRSLKVYAPSKTRYPPHEVKNIVKFSDKYKVMYYCDKFLPQEESANYDLEAVADSAYQLSHVMQIAPKFHHTTVYTDFLSNHHNFSNWVKNELDQVSDISSKEEFTKKKRDFDNIGRTKVVLCESSIPKDLIESGGVQHIPPYIYSTLTTRSQAEPDTYIGGPCSVYSVAFLGDKSVPLPNVQVHQGISAALDHKNLQSPVYSINTRCYKFKEKQICEVGEVDHRRGDLWEAGDPESNDYLGIYLGNYGQIVGARTVGSRHHKKLAVLHEALQMGIVPKLPRFFENKSSWKKLHSDVTKRLESAEKKGSELAIDYR